MNQLIINSFVTLLDVLQIMILARVLLSWFPQAKSSKIIKLIFTITEPILAPIRAILSKISSGKLGMLDFSPLVAMLLIYVIEGMIAR